MVEVVQAYELVRIKQSNKRGKLDDHGEATRSHELNLHELASGGMQRLCP
jgi:hypothetical protein